MKNLRKILGIMCAAVMTASFAGCSGGETTTTAGGAAADAAAGGAVCPAVGRPGR